MPSVPREWAYRVQTGSGARSQIIVAAPLSNLSLVLTEISYKVFNAAVGAGAFIPSIEVLDGVTSRMIWPLTFDLTVINEVSDVIASPFTISPGAALTVRFSIVTPVNVGQALRIAGYAM